MDNFPYWYPDKTQSALRIVGRMIGNSIGDLPKNRIPGQTDYNQSDVRVVRVPRVQQDTNTIKLGNNTPQFGVVNPGTLTDQLNASLNGAGSDSP